MRNYGSIIRKNQNLENDMKEELTFYEESKSISPLSHLIQSLKYTIPLFVILAICFITLIPKHISNQIPSPVMKSYESSLCANCPSEGLTQYCSNISLPVLGGLDFVDFIQRMNETNFNSASTQGSIDYSTKYLNYIFYFKSLTHKQLFETNPQQYLPQFGGFCSWGISSEICPKYAWSPDCLGPSGNWHYYYFYQEKLYFFYKEEAKSKFVANPDYWIPLGETRWSQWFNATTMNGLTPLYNTKCYIP